ncbi:MAG UNVERIFIED_CONTAM: hypothetical protein LVR29_09750 [Microcystis novacekii LVE1205-3]|jgi:hypothetical protein
MNTVNLEIQQAERDYDYNRAAELKFGKLTDSATANVRPRNSIAPTNKPPVKVY